MKYRQGLQRLLVARVCQWVRMQHFKSETCYSVVNLIAELLVAILQHQLGHLHRSLGTLHQTPKSAGTLFELLIPF